MKKAHYIVISVISLGLLFGFQVNLDPSHIDVLMKSGAIARKTLTLSNSGTEVLQVRVYLNDWALDKNAKSFLPAGTTGYSLKNNVKIFPTNFNLNPHDSKSVVLSLSSQKGDPDGQYGVVFFDIQPSSKLKGSGVSIGGRLGTLISKEAEDRQVSPLIITSASVKLKANKLSLTLSGNNPNAVVLRPKVTLVLTNDKNDVLYKGLLPAEYILMPHASSGYVATVTLVKPILEKDLSALLTFDLGEDGFIMKEFKVAE